MDDNYIYTSIDSEPMEKEIQTEESLRETVRKGILSAMNKSIHDINKLYKLSVIYNNLKE